MSARCCTGAALGREHSPSCVGGYMTKEEREYAESIPTAEQAERMRLGRDRGESWRAERARNLREQRRYEIASEIYIREMAAFVREGWSVEDYATRDVLARGVLVAADIFLDELTKAVPE